jgi:hypothetical protein
LDMSQFVPPARAPARARAADATPAVAPGAEPAQGSLF